MPRVGLMAEKYLQRCDGLEKTRFYLNAGLTLGLSCSSVCVMPHLNKRRGQFFSSCKLYLLRAADSLGSQESGPLEQSLPVPCHSCETNEFILM